MPIGYCLLPVAFFLLPVAFFLLPIACCLLPIAYCLLEITYCLLPNAYCLSPSAHRLLPSVYYLLPPSQCAFPVQPFFYVVTSTVTRLRVMSMDTWRMSYSTSAYVPSQCCDRSPDPLLPTQGRKRADTLIISL